MTNAEISTDVSNVQVGGVQLSVVVIMLCTKEALDCAVSVMYSWGMKAWGMFSRALSTSANFWMLNFWTTNGGAPKGGRPKFRVFSLSRATIFILSSLSCSSSRGILVVFEAPGPSNVRVWSSRVAV